MLTENVITIIRWVNEPEEAKTSKDNRDLTETDQSSSDENKCGADTRPE